MGSECSRYECRQPVCKSAECEIGVCRTTEEFLCDLRLPAACGGGCLEGEVKNFWDAPGDISKNKRNKSTLLSTLKKDLPESKMKLIVICDPGQDNDDEMAMVLLSELHRVNELEPLAIVTNTTPAASRAALMRGTLDELGLQDVPVGIGTDGGQNDGRDTFSSYISAEKTGVDYFTPHLEAVHKIEALRCSTKAASLASASRIYPGKQLIYESLENADDKSVTMLCLSSLKDAAQVLREKEDLFAAKVKCVTIMGAAQPHEAPNAAGEVLLIPDETAQNNCHDRPSTRYFYRRVQELGIQMVIVSRFAAYGCPIQRSVYDLMIRTAVPNPVVCRLHAAQRENFERLWKSVNACEKTSRCDKEWFCNTFCGGHGKDRSPNDTIWDVVTHFHMYDPLALLAALGADQDWFFCPERILGLHGTMHLLVGQDPHRSGISPTHIQMLQNFLLATWMRAAEFNIDSARARRRPSHLESLCAAFAPAHKQHTAEKVKDINAKVLNLLDNEWPALKSSSFLDTWRDRDRLISEIGPPMVLLHWETIESLGRIPHSEEGREISMVDAEIIAKQAGKRFFIEMFSHRWSSPQQPDNQWNSKARALVEWAKYRWSIGLGTFFWIDYTCINQNDVAPGVAMLPLYVSSCSNIICWDADEYETRAWCRVERLMFAAFVAPNNEFIDQDFKFKDHAERLENSELKELKPRNEVHGVLPDPELGDLSYPTDKTLIQDLKSLCTKHWGKCWKDGLLEVVERNGVGLQGCRKLQLGKTEVRIRKF